ncbi:MAG: hypothetical protein V1886_03330 [archaeon]
MLPWERFLNFLFFGKAMKKSLRTLLVQLGLLVLVLVVVLL